MRFLTRRGFLKRAMVYGPVAGLGAYGMGVERFAVQVNTYQVPVRYLPSAFEGFRIVQLADLHYNLFTPLPFVRYVIGLINSIPRDIVVCTGDYVNGRNTTRPIDRVWPALQELSAPMGVYAVLGNHDHHANAARSIYWLKESGFGLRRKIARLEKNGQSLWLAGAGDTWMDHTPLDALLDPIPEEGRRIVLAHNPDTADQPHTRRCDLFICGHTHGGQVKIPFYGPAILPVRNKTYTQGLQQSLRNEPVFICKGIGWAFLPIRLNCAPEIAVLELRCVE